jgi:hypothetical protein
MEAMSAPVGSAYQGLYRSAFETRAYFLIEVKIFDPETSWLR